MEDESDPSVRNAEDLAMKNTADERSETLRKEYQEHGDEVTKPDQNLKPSDVPPKSKNEPHVKKEVPEMNIRLQR